MRHEREDELETLAVASAATEGQPGDYVELTGPDRFLGIAED